MSHQPEQNPQSITTFASLEGGWLRKERERIAIGRKALATKLGSSESRVHTIEWRRQPVPMEWLPVLRGLSFRIPDEVDAALGTTSQQSDSQQVAAPVAESVAAPSVESVEAPVAESVAAPVVQSAVESAVEIAVAVAVESVVEATPSPVVKSVRDTVVETTLEVVTPSAAVVESVAVTAAESAPSQAASAAESVAVVESVAAPVEVPVVDAVVVDVAPSSLSQREPPPAHPAQPLQLYHGRWLRERRYERAVRMQTLIQKLQSSEAELYALERHNIRLPLRWIPRMLKLGLLTLEEAKAASRLPRMSQLDGIWLERQRALLKMSPDELGKHLHVSGADIRLVESRAWLVPSEWFPKLTTLLEDRRAAKAKAKALADAAKAENKAGLKKPAPSSLSIRSDKSDVSGKAESKPTSKAEPKTEARSEPKSEAPAATKNEVKSDSRTESRPSSSRSGARRPVAKDSTQLLIESVVEHRIKLGLHAKQPAIDVMGMIAQDLRLALGPQAVSYETLGEVLRVLIRR